MLVIDMASLTKAEKKLVVYILKEHLLQVQKTEKLPGQNILDLAAELKYDKFIKEIVKKLQ